MIFFYLLGQRPSWTVCLVSLVAVGVTNSPRFGEWEVIVREDALYSGSVWSTPRWSTQEEMK